MCRLTSSSPVRPAGCREPNRSSFVHVSVSGTMVWEAATQSAPRGEPTPLTVQSSHTQMEHAEVVMAADGEQLRDLLCFEQGLPASPGFPSSNSYVEYDDLPDLQEVPEEVEPKAYQLDVGVSHQERNAHALPAPDTRWLTQLAVIATGPQSPLLQDHPGSSSSPVGPVGNLHSYARPPPCATTRALSPPRGQARERRRNRTSSECDSAVSTRSSLSDDEDSGWSSTWPPTVWHCFLKGTRLRFHRGPNVEWQDVEDLDSGQEDADEENRSTPLKSYGSEGLQLVQHSEIVLSGQTVLQLTFDPGVFGHTPLTVRCQLDHPFYVKDKGWTSFYPGLTVVHHGIPCRELEVGALCLPPGHRDAKHADDSLVCEKIRSYDFTPLDYSAVYVLSSMARRRRTSQSSGGAVSPNRHSSKVAADWNRPSHSDPPPQQSQSVGAAAAAGGSGAKQCKRPMNAFMLFAKKFRVEYTQMYPGKDNRAISVLLGERWKRMRGEERRVFTVQAKALADEQKRINPDCWKRKRATSGCQ